MVVIKQMPNFQSIFSIPSNRTIILTQLIIIICLLYKLSVTPEYIDLPTPPCRSSPVEYIYTKDYTKAVSQWTNDIYRIGMKHRCSKMYHHEYQALYGIHLGIILRESTLLI